MKHRLATILFCGYSASAFGQSACDPHMFAGSGTVKSNWDGRACLNKENYLVFPGGNSKEEKNLSMDIMSLDHRAHEELGSGTPEWKEVLGMLSNASNLTFLYNDVEAGRMAYQRAEQTFTAHIQEKSRQNVVLGELWREHQNSILGVCGALVVLLSYTGVLGLALLFAPARLARAGRMAGLEDLPKANGMLGLLYGFVSKAIAQITLPYFCRHPRVRRAWLKRYREGKASLGDLGKPARASFVNEADVLDAWVQTRTERVLAALNQLDLLKQRRIYVEVPVRVADPQSGSIIEQPTPETLRGFFSRGRSVVAIVGAGGSGKSTLACALARWAVSDDPKQRLTDHPMLPVFVIEDTTDLVQSITRNLRRMAGDDELPDDLVRGLLAQQRLLVIVDALSEREPATQRHVEQLFGENTSLCAIVITSRTEPLLGPVDRTTLYPVRLDAAHVVPFIIGYLDRMEHADSLKDGRVQLRLGERILALAEAGGRRTPVTPLLVTLLVNSALDRAADGKSLDTMPDAIPEVFIDYLRRLNSSGGQATPRVSDEIFIRAAQILAEVSLGSNLLPQDFSQIEAGEALVENGVLDEAAMALNFLIASGLIERRTPGGIPMLRFSLDPAAEYLFAIRKVFGLKAAGGENWQQYVAELTRRDGYPDLFNGYLMAFATSYQAYRLDFNLPDVHFPWEEGKVNHQT